LSEAACRDIPSGGRMHTLSPCAKTSRRSRTASRYAAGGHLGVPASTLSAGGSGP
jgi:hypothetical protein